MMPSRRWTDRRRAAAMLSVMLLVGSLSFCASAPGQDSTRSGLEKLRLRGEDPSMTRIVPDTPPVGIPPFPEFRPVQKTAAPRRIKLNGREAFVPANIWVHPNPLMSQTEISVITHPMDPDIVFIGSNSILSGRDSIFFGSQGWYHTSDAGVSWTGSDTFPTHGSSASFLADPAVNIDLDSNLFFGAIRFGADNDVVIDRAASATGPWYESNIPEVAEAEDKQHTVVDRSIISPYRDMLYTVYTDFDSSRSPYPLMFSRSTDRGIGFSSPVIISDRVGESFAQGGNVATGAMGEIFVAWSGYDDWPPPVKTRIGFNKSTDGGTTWRGARSLRTIDDIRGFLYKGQNILRVNSFPSLAVDISDGPRRGWIYLVYTERSPVVKVWMMRSTDGGENWSEPIKVGRELPRQINDQWFPWVCVDPATGALYVVYYDSRNSINNDSTDVFVSTSVDGGEEFEDVRVNDVSFVPTVVPGAAYGYMGDYIGITALNGIVWPSWNDNRTGIHQAYTSRIEFLSINSQVRIGVAPDTVEFGRVFKGFVDSTGFTIRNLGISDTLLVTGITSSSTMISVPISAGRLPPGKTFRVTLVVDPQVLGPFSAMISFSNNDSTQPLIQLPVRGEVINPPVFTMDTDSLQEVLTTGDTVLRYLEIRNDGAGDLRFSVSTSITWMDAIPQSTLLAPGESTMIVAKIKSGNLNDGMYRSYINITSSDPMTPFRRIPVSLRILGIPRVRYEPVLIVIDDVAVGYRRSVNLRIFNTGTYPLVLSDFRANHTALQIVAPETLRILPRRSGTIQITFMPAVEESVNTVILFSSTDPGNPEVAIPVNTFGYQPPEISITPENFRVSLYRGDVTSALISLYNNGPGTLHWHVIQDPVTNSSVGDGTSPSAVRTVTAPWVTLFPSQGSIGAGRSGAIEMSIDSRTLLFRSYLVEILVSSNDPDRPAVLVQVIVSVQRLPNVTVSPNVITFQSAFIGFSDTATFTLRNATSKVVIVVDDSMSNPVFALAEILPVDVNAGSERKIAVVFRPVGPEVQTGTLFLTTSDRTSGLLSVALQGDGKIPPSFSVVPDTSSVSDILSGDTAVSRIRVRNSGSSLLNLSAAVLPIDISRNGSSGTSISRTVYLPYVLRDSLGYKWDIQNDGSILDGSDDAFDGAFKLNGFQELDVAVTEDGGREVVLGPVRSGTLLLTRKIFVSGHSGFVRYLEVIQNDNILPTTVDLTMYSNLGSDLDNAFVQTSTHDTVFSTDDNWIVTDDGPDVNDPAVVSVFADDEYHVRPSNVTAIAGSGNLTFRFQFALGAQSRAIVMHFGAQRRNIAEGEIIATSLQGLEGDALSGMSPEERRLVVNFGINPVCTVSPKSLSVSPGSESELHLRYDATLLPGGLYSPVLRLTTNDPGKRIVELPLAVNVTDAPRIAEWPDPLRFAPVLAGSRDTAAIAVYNFGSLPLQVTSVQPTSGDFRVITPLPISIASGEANSLRIEFSPSHESFYAETLSILTNDPVHPRVSLPVEARSYPRPIVQLSSDSIHLRGITGEKPTANLVVRNLGEGPLRFTAKTLTSGIVESQSGSKAWEMSQYKTRGNIYHVKTQHVLQEFRAYLDIQDPTLLEFVVCRSRSSDGMYQVIHRSRSAITDFGQDFFGSGPIGIVLEPGNYYFLGISILGDATSFYSVSPFLVPVSFGEIISTGFATSTDLPDSLAIRRQTYTMFHQSIVTNPSGVVPTIEPGTGEVAAGDSIVVSVSLPYSLPVGEYAGRVQFSTIETNEILAEIPVVARFVVPPPAAPELFALEQNYPNPFNGATMIRYQLAQKSSVSITIFNVLGQVVAKLIEDRVEEKGTHAVPWESAPVPGATPGTGYSSGVYFYRLDTAPIPSGGRSYTEIRKMLLLK